MNEARPARRRGGVALPIILILLGVLFLLSEFAPRLALDRTWPVILILVGAFLLARSVAPPRPPRGPDI